MANQLYPSAKAVFIGDTATRLDLDTDTIKVALIDTGVYTFSTAHDFFNDVTGQVGASVTLTSPTVALGVFDAADATFATVSGATVEALIIYKDTGSAATSPLIAYIDTATGLPVTPNGGNINIVWDSGANKIFAL